MIIKNRKVLVIGVIGICVIALLIAIFAIIFQNKTENTVVSKLQINIQDHIQNFNNIFDNTCDYQGNEVTIMKEYGLEEIIYTSYSKQEKKENLYNLDVSIPYINLDSMTARTINNEINQQFYERVIRAVTNTNQYTIYTVKYKAYINDNILSLIIQANLKEGENPERKIITTYNYNLASQNKLGIAEVLQYRNISEESAQDNIKKSIKNIQNDINQSNTFQYFRNEKASQYQLANTKQFFLGKDKAIYIIYAYGNDSYRTDFDLVVM